MPCDVNVVKANACASGIGKVTSEVKLLQMAAQAAANWVSQNSPGTDVSVNAILTRARASGVGCQADPTKLYQAIAQNLCNLS